MWKLMLYITSWVLQRPGYFNVQVIIFVAMKIKTTKTMTRVIKLYCSGNDGRQKSPFALSPKLNILIFFMINVLLSFQKYVTLSMAYSHWKKEEIQKEDGLYPGLYFPLDSEMVC